LFKGDSGGDSDMITESSTASPFRVMFTSAYGLTVMSDDPKQDANIYNAYLQHFLDRTTSTTFNLDGSITVAANDLASITYMKEATA
jgi:hypothetical protein